MAKSNRERVEDALGLVASGFGQFVEDQLRNQYGHDWIKEVTAKGNWGGKKGGQKAKLSDPDFVLWAAGFEWQSVFRKILGQTERGLIVGPLIQGLRWFLETFMQSAMQSLPETMRDVTPIIVPWSIPLAFGISMLIGVVFGLYPARRAARMNVIDALRHVA